MIDIVIISELFGFLFFSMVLLLYVRKPKSVKFTFNLIQLYKDIYTAVPDNEKLESYNIVKSLFINIVAGFLSLTISLYINTYNYNDDKNDIETNTNVNKIIKKYKSANAESALSNINSKIQSNDEIWEKLKEFKEILQFGALILCLLFMFTWPEYREDYFFANVLIDFSISTLAFGFVTAITFIDTNNFIFASSYVGFSFILLAIAFWIKK